MRLTFILAILLGTQGIPVAANQSGTITGVLKDAAGKPASGVRVGAIAQPESAGELSNASAMVSIDQTDETGRFRLENIPPGKYFIAAGRVDFPTYYPGTQALARGTIIAITPGANITGIDFTMQNSSVRLPGSELLPTAALTFSLPVQVAVEGGGKLPVFSPAGFAFIRLTNVVTGIQTDIPINASKTLVSGPTTEYRVSIQNLPPGYGVKSMMAGKTNLAGNTLKLSTLNFSAMVSGGIISPFTLASTPLTAMTDLSVTLAAPPAPRPGPGVRITGKGGKGERRSIYLDGKPGMFYSDGTFEFRGVDAGRHRLATIENPESLRPLGISLIVGARDVEGVDLEEVSLLPQDIRTATPAGDVGTYPAGSVVRPASLHVAVVDQSTREPAGPGTVFVIGPSGTSFDLPADGRFEFQRLLPGKYDFEIQAFRHATITRNIVIGDEDINLELAVTSVE